MEQKYGFGRRELKLQGPVLQKPVNVNQLLNNRALGYNGVHLYTAIPHVR